MRVIDPAQTATPDMHQFLVGAVAPRPIAFVSTVDEQGVSNLAPYSFFNVFSAKPPVLVFSSNRKVRDNTTKDTLHNVEQTGEVVINVVSHRIVRQMAVSSIGYPPEVDEFKKSGLTAIDSDLIRPKRVAESPVHMECKVDRIISLGAEGGAGHLIICTILRMHIAEEVIDERGRIDPHRIDLMGRMGRAYYVRASGEAIHSIYQPGHIMGIGYDALPRSARQSKLLTGNDLGKVAGLNRAPSAQDIQQLQQEAPMQELLDETDDPVRVLHELARSELNKEHTERAASMLWLAELLLTDPSPG